MTNTAKFQLCLERAKRLVAAYRAVAPEGFDPQNTWVTVGVGVAGLAVSAGTAAYQSNQQKKASKAAGGAQSGVHPVSEVKFPAMPDYIPVDWRQAQSAAVAGDTTAYRLSDADRAARHPGVVGAEGAFERQLTKDWAGENELSPALQAELMQSGLGNTLGALGDVGPVLAGGSGGEASLAKNLGLGIMNFQDRNRAQREKSLSLGEVIAQPRQIGLTGSDIAGIGISNISALNAWRQADHSEKVQELQFNAQLSQGAAATAQNTANARAAAQGQQSAAQGQLIAGLASSALQVGGQAAGAYAGSRPTSVSTYAGGSTTPTTTTITSRV